MSGAFAASGPAEMCLRAMLQAERYFCGEVVSYTHFRDCKMSPSDYKMNKIQVAMGEKTKPRAAVACLPIVGSIRSEDAPFPETAQPGRRSGD